MKAFLLSAGRGTRLQPLTVHTPKCLVVINGRPLMEYWFDLLELYGIYDVLINTSHLAGKVTDYVKNNSRGLNIRLSYEDHLLGSGGTIKKNWDFVEGERSFFILYSDNLTNINLKDMLSFHNHHKKYFTLALIRVPNPGECGIVEIGDDSSVLSFTEKPEHPCSNLAFAGIMLCSQKLKEFFPDKEIFDLGYDVLPKLAGKVAGYVMSDYLLDIGTPEKLIQAEGDIRNSKFSLTKQAIDGKAKIP
jgi:mannose-1-phosphate guanylyltransferase